LRITVPAVPPPANIRRLSGTKSNYENIGMLDRDELRIGDYVLIHVGFAMSKVDEKEAVATLRLLQDLGSYEAEVAQDEIH